MREVSLAGTPVLVPMSGDAGPGMTPAMKAMLSSHTTGTDGVFSARIRIRNNKPYDTSGIIYAGTVIETLDPFSRVQNLSVAQNVSFTVPAGQVEVVSVPAWCLNQSYSPPRGTPMRVTRLAVAPYGSQDEVWSDIGRRR